LAIRPAPPYLIGTGRWRWGCYEPEVDPELEPDDGGVPEPAGGVPVWVPEPLPILGQLCVEPEPDPLLEPEDVLGELELVLLDPEFPVLVLVDEVDVELVPELPVVVEVVAALATSAPPVTSPVVSAPMASTLRRRICMGGLPFRLV
jgi:hypothetical protein